MLESASEGANLLCKLNKFNVKQTGHYANRPIKLKKIMNDSMFDRSLEGIEGKVKLIFDYLDSIEEEFESFVSFNEKITEVKQTN